MSLLGSIGGALKGAVGGFFSSGGNPLGALAGALPQGGDKAQKRRLQATSGAIMPVNNVSSYSASPSSRLAGLPGVQLATTTGGGGATGSWVPSGKMRYSHNVVDATTGRVYRVSNKTGKIIKPRQMNPLNGRAARRAIRRIRGARKMLQAIERSLPKARTRQTRAR